MKQLSVLSLIFIIALFPACASVGYNDGSPSFSSLKNNDPSKKEAYTGFCDEFLGDSIFADILLGFTPISMLCVSGDIIRSSVKDSRRQKEMTDVPAGQKR